MTRTGNHAEMTELSNGQMAQFSTGNKSHAQYTKTGMRMHVTGIALNQNLAEQMASG